MQDNWQEFDRMIGSTLQDAEEKAPRRVWRAVSARLDQAAAAAAWWRWAVPAFAMAALVALGLFLTGTFNKTAPVAAGTDIIVAQNTDNSEELVPTEQLPESPEEQAVLDSGLKTAAATRRLAQAGSSAADNAAQAVSDQAESDGPVVSQTEEVADSPSADTVKDSQVSDQEAAEAAEQWARIESEDARVASRIKFSNLYAQGGVGGNDSNISYGGNGISRMAPGKGSPSAGITESSTSTYGVPFTIGLGARFNVAPKLSLGTGLEYSLLTRTFTGSYSDSYTGSIAHNVQYVGIPVNVYYDLFSTRDNLLNLYAWGGGSAEVCVANSYKLLGSESAPTIKDNAGSMQFSAALGLGFQFKLSDKLGLYVDPAVRYYFHGNQPKSIRTDKPLMFNMEAGLRFNL